MLLHDHPLPCRSHGAPAPGSFAGRTPRDCQQPVEAALCGLCNTLSGQERLAQTGESLKCNPKSLSPLHAPVPRALRGTLALHETCISCSIDL